MHANVLEWRILPKNLPREEYVLQGATLALLYLEHMALVTPAQATHPLYTSFLPTFLNGYKLLPLLLNWADDSMIGESRLFESIKVAACIHATTDWQQRQPFQRESKIRYWQYHARNCTEEFGWNAYLEKRHL